MRSSTYVASSSRVTAVLHATIPFTTDTVLYCETNLRKKLNLTVTVALGPGSVKVSCWIYRPKILGIE